MGEDNNLDIQNIDQQQSNTNKILKGFSSWTREALAIFCWGYVITKLFFFDIDVFLISRLLPNHAWLINYKFFIFIGIITIILLLTKNRTILLWSLFVFFYPLIILFWRIPFFIFKRKSWGLAFAFIDSIVSFVRSFKKTFITASLFLISAAIILGFSNKFILGVSIMILLIIVFLVYIQRILLVVKPSGTYQAYGKLFSFAGNNVRNVSTTMLDEDSLKMPVEHMEEEQIQKWVAEVQNIVFFNRTCLFVAKQLKAYQNSGLKIVSLMFGILLIILFAIFSFAFINLGLYKINQHFYSYITPPSFFIFFYYSFGVLLLNPIQDVVATSPITQVIFMVESSLAFFLGVIFVSLVFSVKSQRDVDELNEVIKNLTEEGKRVEVFIKERYKLNDISAALEALQKLKATLIGILYNITEEIE